MLSPKQCGALTTGRASPGMLNCWGVHGELRIESRDNLVRPRLTLPGRAHLPAGRDPGQAGWDHLCSVPPGLEKPGHIGCDTSESSVCSAQLSFWAALILRSLYFAPLC